MQMIDDKHSKPLVSIGLPVYNGERFLRESLNSLLAQDYDNFEILISDNASTDSTSEICREYVTRDKRIQYKRNETNLGATKNFNLVSQLAKGKYFMWAGDHDLWHPSFISRLASLLENSPGVVLAYPRTLLIDMDGRVLEMFPDKIDTRNMEIVQRYKQIVKFMGWGNMVYGLMRRDALVRTGNYRNLYFADKVFISELSMLGTIAQIDEPLFYRRRNRPPESGDAHVKSMLYRMDPSNAASSLKRSVAYLLMESHIAFLKGLFSSHIGLKEKIELFGFLTRFFMARYIEIISP